MINRILTRVRYIWRNTPLGRVKKAPDALKWGFIGTGYMSDTFSRAIAVSNDNILYAIASRSIDKARRFARSHGHPIPYGSMDDMLAVKEIDIVYVATPVECHFEQVKKCLEARKHVLCEKPLTMDASQAEELFKIARENDCLLMEGMWSLCLPTMRIAQQWITDGRIGRIELIRADINKRLNPKHVHKHHGIMYDYGIYGIAFMHAFMFGHDKVSSTISRKDSEGYTTDIAVLYNSGACKGILNLSSNFNSAGKAVIIGSEGSIEWDSQFNRTNTVRLFDKNAALVEIYSPKYTEEGFEFELEEVTRSVKSGLKENSILSSRATIDCLETINAILNG